MFSQQHPGQLTSEETFRLLCHLVGPQFLLPAGYSLGVASDDQELARMDQRLNEQLDKTLAESNKILDEQFQQKPGCVIPLEDDVIVANDPASPPCGVFSNVLPVVSAGADTEPGLFEQPQSTDKRARDEDDAVRIAREKYERLVQGRQNAKRYRVHTDVYSNALEQRVIQLRNEKQTLQDQIALTHANPALEAEVLTLKQAHAVLQAQMGEQLELNAQLREREHMLMGEQFQQSLGAVVNDQVEAPPEGFSSSSSVVPEQAGPAPALFDPSLPSGNRALNEDRLTAREKYERRIELERQQSQRHRVRTKVYFNALEQRVVQLRNEKQTLQAQRQVDLGPVVQANAALEAEVLVLQQAHAALQVKIGEQLELNEQLRKRKPMSNPALSTSGPSFAK